MVPQCISFTSCFWRSLGRLKSKYYVKDDTSQQISNGRCLRMLRSDIFSYYLYIHISTNELHSTYRYELKFHKRYCGLGRSPLRILCFLLACDIDDPALVMAGYG